MFKSNFSSQNGFDPFELKDSVSEHSMDRDSAYQSQTGRSQRGHTRPDGNQWMSAYDASATHNHFPGSNLTSPTLGPSNSTPFSEHPNFNQAHHADGLDAWTTDASAEQVIYSPYSSTNTTQNSLSMHPYGMGYASWDTPTTTPLAPFASYDAHQDVALSMFDIHALSQPQGVSMIGAPAMPAVHNSPSFAPTHDMRRASAQSAAISTYSASPPTATKLSHEVEFRQQQTDVR